MLFSTLKKINIEKCPFTYWLNGRWFLQIVDGDSWNLLYPLYPLFLCSDFVSQIWGGLGGGGVMFFSHILCYFQHFSKNILGIQTNYFSFNVFFMFFLYVAKYKSAPSLTATG